MTDGDRTGSIIWFASLNKERSSEIYSLYEIRREDGSQINATASYDKQYLEGRYGADLGGSFESLIMLSKKSYNLKSLKRQTSNY